jgi:hypothetical protein
MTTELSHLASFLKQQGYHNQLISETGTVPIEQLLVLLGKDYQERTLQLEILFIPKIEELDVLQFFILMPYKLEQVAILDLSRFILFINQELPLGSFGINESRGWIYYRHLNPCFKKEIKDNLILKTMWMINYIINTFNPFIEEVATDRKNFYQAKADFEKGLARLISLMETQD